MAHEHSGPPETARAEQRHLVTVEEREHTSLGHREAPGVDLDPHAEGFHP
jgi:hypothetical protein